MTKTSPLPTILRLCAALSLAPATTGAAAAAPSASALLPGDGGATQRQQHPGEKLGGAEASAPFEEDAGPRRRELKGNECHKAADPHASCPPCWSTNSCCMQDYMDIYTGNNAGCTTNSIDFQEVTGFHVYDEGAYRCNCDGVGSPEKTSPHSCATILASTGDEPLPCQGMPHRTWFDAYRGDDDNVQVSFTVNIDAQPEYDVALYINANGGDSITGSECFTAGLIANDTNTGEPWVTLNQHGVNITMLGNPDADGCLDVVAAGMLKDFPFEKVTLQCVDSDGDGLLDFHVSASFAQSSVYDCSFDDVTTLDPNGDLAPPVPGNGAKCWGGERVTLDIFVPGVPTPTSTPSVSSAPSGFPSVTTGPSSAPSENPSLSIMPSEMPSLEPSASADPSSAPSENPSLSIMPSEKPSLAPSDIPSEKPSLYPSESPSLEPSFHPSQHPSLYPSESPSLKPSDVPSLKPSGVPSETPTLKPSQGPSDEPTEKPSFAPSVSSAPTTKNKPSLEPSSSQAPTYSPSGAPSISKPPSVSPTYHPSDSPSVPPTASLYYPDWEHPEQICTNDGGDPLYMKRIQRDNYLYVSKEECCQAHFWWRVTQCMDNEHTMYYSNGDFCDAKSDFEDWEAKYTPTVWDHSDLFLTVEECCAEKFWWDIDACIAASPKTFTFDVSFDLCGLNQPSICQDADSIANALQYAMDKGLGADTESNVTAIGCATLVRNPDTGNPECGGCIDGPFSGDWDGTREAGYYVTNSSQATTIQVEIVSKCDDCEDAASIEALYNQVLSRFTDFYNSGNLQTEIISWAKARGPPLPELWYITTCSPLTSDPSSLTNPLDNPETPVEVTHVTMTGGLSVPGLNEPVEVVEITTTGELSVSGMDTSSLNSTELTSVMTFYEEALASELGLPPGSTVTVTSIQNGVVEYEIVTYADSGTDANTAVSLIESTLSQTSTMDSIGASVIASSQAAGGTVETALASTSVDDFTEGATTTSMIPQVTVEGVLATDLNPASIASFTAEQEEEAMAFFESALTQSLTADGLLPDGAQVAVTGINDDGTVEYQIIFSGNTATADASTSITNIGSSLADPSTLASISTSVQTASGSSTTGITASLSNVGVSGNTQVSTSGLTMSAAEEEELMSYFEDAVKTSLGPDLPEGATVVITSIVDGVVSYELSFDAESSSDASAAISSIQKSLSTTTTLNAITASVTASASSSSNPALANVMSGATVASDIPGETTQTLVSKVTSSGSLTTNLIGLSAAEVAEASEYFEDSIQATLEAEGALPPGSKVTVTGIDANGVVQYTITMYQSPEADSASVVTGINSVLSSSTAQAAIAAAVASEASASGSSITALASLDVTGFIQGEARGVSFKLWYPDWINPENYCSNDGRQPPFMNEDINVGEYLFTTKKECCDKWFLFAWDCDASNALEFYVDYEKNTCSRKPMGEFLVWERNRYATLDECCSANFQWKLDDCCDAEDAGGCTSTAGFALETATQVSTSGTLSVPGLNQEAQTVEATTTGSFTVSNFVITDAQKAEATTFFQDALAKELSLPQGSTITVTSITNGVIQYEIAVRASSGGDVNTAVGTLQSTLSQASTMTSITASVNAASQASSDLTLRSAMALTSVDSNSAGSTASPSTTSKVTVEGVFATSLDPSAFTAEQEEEAKVFFASAIAQQLGDQGVLPEGASVVVTGLDDYGRVQYEISLVGVSGAESSTAITSIGSSLSESSTLAAISSTVQVKSAGSTATPSIAGAMASVSVSGNTQVSTSGLTMTAAEEEEAKTYFAEAIESSLGGTLPDGASVTVTSIENGSVEYEIIMNVDSSADAGAVVASMKTSLAKKSTLNAITNSVVSASSGSSNPSLVNAMSGATVASNTPGTTTESTVAKLTSLGQLTTNLSGLSSAEAAEAAGYFEESIAATLQANGALPLGSKVTVTDIDANGVVSYAITLFAHSSSDHAGAVRAVNSALSSSTTQAAIATATSLAASASGSSIAALSSLQVTGFIERETSGVNYHHWYPDWSDHGKYCSNNGRQPPYMNEAINVDEYLFATKSQCCEKWFSFAPDCDETKSTPLLTSGVLYYPKFDSDVCSKKSAEDFDVWERLRYDTLEKCCDSLFSYNRDDCCSEPGMGGCSDSTKEESVVYLPDWTNSKCESRSSKSVTDHEEKYVRGSMKSCCSDHFFWSNSCVKKSK